MAFESEASNARNEISYAQEHLTAHVVEVSLKEVLLVVAKEAKLEFALNEAIAAKKVSVWFDKLPLEKGIKRIIRPFSCSMIFDSSGRLKKVTILKSGSHSAKVTVSGKNDDPSPSPGPEDETAIPSEGEDYDPSLGPAGQTDEGPPPSAPGPETEGEMADLLEVEDYDPSLGPAGQPDEGPPPSAPGPGKEGEMADLPGVKYPTPSEKSP